MLGVVAGRFNLAHERRAVYQDVECKGQPFILVAQSPL